MIDQNILSEAVLSLVSHGIWLILPLVPFPQPHITVNVYIAHSRLLKRKNLQDG